MDLWFHTEEDVSTFDRLTTMKEALFDIFADHDRIPPVLDYIGMVCTTIFIWPASRKKGPSNITDSVDQDQPLLYIENSYT